MQYVRKSFANVLDQLEKFEAVRVISRYEEALRTSFMITSTFQDIVNGNLDKKRQFKQLLIHFLILVVTVRYLFFCSLYITSEETREYYQYWFQDYWETLGILGRTLNASFATAILPVVINMFYLRHWESCGKLEFLTEPLSFPIQDKSINQRFDKESQLKFLSLLNLKLIIWKFGYKAISNACHFLQIFGCAVFLYKKADTIFIGFSAVVDCIVNSFGIHFATLQLLSLFLSFHAIVDYFTARVKSLIHEFEGTKDEVTLSIALNHYNRLMLDFEKRNYCIRYLIRNVSYGYCLVLSLILVLSTVEVNWWMRLIMSTGSSIFSLSIIATEVYLGSIHELVIKLYKEVCSTAARFAGGNRHEISVKSKLKLQTAIRELGSSESRGQYTIGLTNGNSGPYTTMNAVEVALETCGLTLLLLSSLYHS